MKNSTAQATAKYSTNRISYPETSSSNSDVVKSSVVPHQLPLDSTAKQFVKRTVDLTVSGLLILFLLSWMMPLIALFIKLCSKGPVFFFQKRIAKNGRVFTCVKFRTMVVNSEADSMPATGDDARITRVGRFLRINHLDELPQLFNVLLGQMSLIGPRPHMLSDHLKYEELLNFYNYRHKVKPGITGWAQVHGYVGAINTVDCMTERVKKDIYYIHHWSLLLDAKIVCLTFARMIKK